MFGALKDKFKDAVYGGRLQWQNIVDTFRLVHPSVSVDTRGLEGIPGAFIVRRRSDGIYWIDLAVNKEKALAWIRHDAFGDPEILRIADEPWQNRQYMETRDFDARKTKPDAMGHVLNWGLFDYDCKAGLGEFTAGGWGHNDGFVNTYVLHNDKDRYRRATSKAGLGAH